MGVDFTLFSRSIPHLIYPAYQARKGAYRTVKDRKGPYRLPIRAYTRGKNQVDTVKIIISKLKLSILEEQKA